MVESIEKPIKGISNYKAQDLIKFGIDTFNIDNGIIHFKREINFLRFIHQ